VKETSLSNFAEYICITHPAKHMIIRLLWR